jgi:hypothetical protein
LGALYAAAARGLPTLADSGYDGAGIGVHTPIKQPADNHMLSPDNRTYNRLLRALRCLGERGFALLKAAGGPFSTSPSAPPESATSPARRLSSLISSTTTYRQFAEITSLYEPLKVTGFSRDSPALSQMISPIR